MEFCGLACSIGFLHVTQAKMFFKPRTVTLSPCDNVYFIFSGFYGNNMPFVATLALSFTAFAAPRQALSNTLWSFGNLEYWHRPLEEFGDPGNIVWPCVCASFQPLVLDIMNLFRYITWQLVNRRAQTKEARDCLQ